MTPTHLPWRVATVAASKPESARAKAILLDVPGWPGHLAGQHLDLRLGLVNTIVLLTSSWFVVRAVLAVRHGQPARAVQWIRAAAAAGLIFAVLEGSQWYVEIRAGHTNSDLFFAFYYVLTGVHLLHVLIGLIAFGVLVRELRDPRRRRSPVRLAA